MEKITAYLCNKFHSGIGYEAFQGDFGAVEVADKVVSAALWPSMSVPGCQTSAGKISAQLLKEGDSPYVCKSEDGLLTWEREEIPHTGESIGLEGYITIKIQNSGHCHWIQSYILAYGADGSIFGRLFAKVDVGSSGLPCPENKDDVFSGGGQSTFLMTQNQIVPGERIVLGWVFWDGQHTKQIEVDAKDLCTCCFTGGEVTAINGEYGDTAITYTVEIQGLPKTCVPSDFIEYEVGDWVFVLVPNSTCAENGRKTSCKGGCEDSGNYTILPLKVGNYGA